MQYIMQKLKHIRNVTGLLFHTLVFIACDVNYRLKLSFKMVNAVFTVQQAEIRKGAYCFIYRMTHGSRTVFKKKLLSRYST